MQRLQALQNGHFGSKLKLVYQKMRKTTQPHNNCLVQKTARKNFKYSRNESI